MLTEIFVFLMRTLIWVASSFFLVRFLLQWSRADFYNPISQAVVRITDPLCKPLRAVLPKTRSFDIASPLLAFLVQFLGGFALFSLFTTGIAITDLLIAALANLLRLVTQLYFFALIIVVVMSWVAPQTYHPAGVLVRQLTEPLLAPVRKVLPAVGGLDFSVFVVMTVILILQEIVLARLPSF